MKLNITAGLISLLLICPGWKSWAQSSPGSAGLRINQFKPVEEQVNLLENGNFNLAVGGRPNGWTFEGQGKPYIFNRGMYHAAGLEVADKLSTVAVLVSQPVKIPGGGSYVLSGLFGGGPADTDEVVPTDDAKQGCGFIEVRCYDAGKKRLANGTRFTFKGKRQEVGTRLYRQPDHNFGWIFRRCKLPEGTVEVRVVFGLETAVGRVTADNLVFYKEVRTEGEPLPVAAYDLTLKNNWIKAGAPEAVLIDGVRDPGPEGDINAVLYGVTKYRNNARLVQPVSAGVVFDLGAPCAVEGMEITLAAQIDDLADQRIERFEPRVIRVSFSDDAANFGPVMELLYLPERMQGESLITVVYRGFRRVGRYVMVSNCKVMSEARFFGKKRDPVVLGCRPVISLRAGLLVYGVEVEFAGADNQAFMAKVPKGNVHKIDRNRYADLALVTPKGKINGNVIFDNFAPDKILRRTFFAPEPSVLAEGGASVEVAYHDKVQVWDSPTTFSYQGDQPEPAVELKNILRPVADLTALNQELVDLKKQLEKAEPSQRPRISGLAAAKLSPRLKVLGVEEKAIEELFAAAGSPKTLGPEMLPTIEVPSPDGKAKYKVSVKAPDIFLFSKYDGTTGRYIANEGHAGNYLVAGAVEQARTDYKGFQKKLLEEDETFQKALASTNGWTPCNKTFTLDRGFRAVFRMPFDLPRGGAWTMCYKTLWQFPESKMFLNGKELTVPFRWGQNIVKLPKCRKGANELVILADASQAKINMELKPYQTHFYHLFWLNTDRPVVPLMGPQGCLPVAERQTGKITLIYNDEPVLVDLPAELKSQPAAIQFASLMKPTTTTGFITTRPQDGLYVDEQDRRYPVWGGHWNHLQTYETVDFAARFLPGMGVSTIREIYDGTEQDEATGKWKPDALDKVFYQVAQFGKAGIYLDIGLHSYGWYDNPEGAFYRVESNKDPRGRPLSRLWNPVYLRAQKKYATELLTTVNPYTGRRLVEDPTLISIEIANEDYGMGARGFDYEELPESECTMVRQRFNDWLLAKYKTRKKLEEAWAMEPLTKDEDPAKGNIHFPPQFKTCAKSSNFFHQWDAESRVASPRVSDALEWAWTEVYNFLKTMHDHLRSLGFKGSVSWCGFSTMELQSLDLNPYLRICDSLGGSAYGQESLFRSLERWYTRGIFNRFWGKSTHVREWSSWNQGSDVAESANGLLAAGLFGLAHGIDHWSHHKLGAGAYPSLENEAVQSINPDCDNRRAAVSFVGWAFRRANIPAEKPRLLVGVPKSEVTYGGLNSPCDTQPLKGGYTFLYDQVLMAYYVFEQTYDGPEDMVVMHEGRSPTGDYRKAKHAILWSHGKTDSTGRNKKARDEWFALHGIEFKEGERYKKVGQYLAFNCDLVDDPELNQVIYDTLVEWGVQMPFKKEEIHKIYATLDRSIEVDVELARMKVDRDDFQAWMGRNHGEKTKTSMMSVLASPEQVQVMAIPFDTGSFKTAKQIALWSRTDANIRLSGSFSKEPEIWAVNWVGYRKQQVFPLAWDKDSVTLKFTRDLDVHFYEILR